MYYVCIENHRVCSILPYEPAVPETVSVHVISDDDYALLIGRRHRFNIDLMQVEPLDANILADMDQRTAAIQYREFLNSTDWKVLRHIRQKALGITTSITEQEYLELEQQRQTAADKI